MIRVRNRQSGHEITLEGPKTVYQLLKELNLVEGAVLVMKDGELLTRDVRLERDDFVELIPVISGG